MPGQKQTTRTTDETLYQPADFYLLRAPALPASVFLKLSGAGRVHPQTRDGELDNVLLLGKQDCEDISPGRHGLRMSLSGHRYVPTRSSWERLRLYHKNASLPSMT